MTLAVFVAVMAIVLGVLYTFYEGFPQGFSFGLSMAAAYIFGSVCTTVAAYVGMMAAVEANVRTANAARQGLKKAFPVAFYGGTVMGLFIVGLALLGISLLYYVYDVILGWGSVKAANVVLGFSFGASALALFAKAGGGIYTKTADISADLVGKVEVGIPEDDPRNPAVIADNVGDNVGDVAGMGADLFESYVGSVIATIAVGSTLNVPNKENWMVLPLIVIMFGTIASFLASLSIRIFQNIDPQKALRYSTFVAEGLLIIFAYFIVNNLVGDLRPFWAIVSGVFAGIAIGLLSEYYTSGSPIKSIAQSATTGAATNIIAGIAVGFKSTTYPVLAIAIAVFISYIANEIGRASCRERV